MQSGVHSMSSDPPRLPTGLKNDEGPDILKMRHRGHIYELYFTSFSISDGIVLISDVKSHALQKLKIHPGQLWLSYKGRKLNDDHRAAKEYDLKHNSEIAAVILEPTEVVRAGVESPGFPGISRATGRRKPAGFDPSVPGGDEPMAPRTSAYTPQNLPDKRPNITSILNNEPADPTPSKTRKPNVTPVRRSNLKHAEVHDSGYGSDGGHTPDLTGTSPSNHKATRYRIVEEDKADDVHQLLKPESHHPQTRSPSLFWQKGRRDQPQIVRENKDVPTSSTRPRSTRYQIAEDEDGLAMIGRQEPVRKTGLAERTGSSTKAEPVKKIETKWNNPEIESDQKYLNATKGRGERKALDADDHGEGDGIARFTPQDWAGTFDVFEYFKANKSREGEKAPNARDQDKGDRSSEFSAQEWAENFGKVAWKGSGSHEEEHRPETNNQADTLPPDGVGQRTAKDQLISPEQPARPRSAPAVDFHSNATKAFQEDVFVWSSVTRDFTATLASVDTQSDRNLVYLGFLENDLRVEYKKYGDGEATPLRSLAGNVWPLGWAMLKIFPVKVNPKSGIRERHRPQYVVFDVYDTTTFGDLLLGNEYAEGNDVCNFLMKGSRKASAQTEALRKQREEEFRRFEAENRQRTQSSQQDISTNASANSSVNASA